MVEMTNSSYHTPVLLHAAVEGLNIRPHQNYVDATFGGGGHSREILRHLTTGKLIAFDQDADAVKNASQITSPNLVFVNDNFRNLQRALHQLGIEQVHGILADLGVSTYQFDTAQRGFSFRFDAPLDMRMDQSSPVTAADIINRYTPAELSRMFYLYGEIRNANQLAAYIARYRTTQPVHTTFQLVECVKPFTPRQQEKQFLARLFQALRMEVNAELSALEEFLQQTLQVLAPQGRLVIISYHSLEDRLVKNLVRSGNLEGEVKKDFYGNPIRPLTEITKKPVVPDENEIELNPRSRSAKLRIAEKNKDE
jgi:16S rRNA (cytosine1402-N4)-methyltransferase